MKESTTEERGMGGEWFAAWMPRAASESPASEIPPAPPVLVSNAIDDVRAELKAVTEHLLNPSTEAVRACLPHLERAVAAFGSFVKTKDLPRLEPALDALRTELTLANMLFENAYTLQAGWAAQCGLNLDGTLKQLLYSRPGETVAAPHPVPSEVWEG